MLRAVKNVTWRQRITNEVLFVGLPRISTAVTERRLRFSGHCWGVHRVWDVVVGLLVASRPSNRLVYLRDGSAQTTLRAATLRQKLQITRSVSPSHSILTPGRPVPALTL